MLYTRKGDAGVSGLFGTKERFSKESSVYEALGTVDELNSLLGVCRACALGAAEDRAFFVEIEKVQERLFIIQAELAGAEKTIIQAYVDDIEGAIDRIEKLIQNPHAFVIPGATELSALLDYARAVSRRAERAVIKAQGTRSISSKSRAYLNRLSSLLYALARYAAREAGAKEHSPSY
jgi:cob(I)alamin adenosyltransferase